jgi:CRP-like cAMP-binding protein
MAKHRKIHTSGQNRLLAALPRDDYDRLLLHLEKVPLTLRDILYQAHGPIGHVYFPLDGVVSLVIKDNGFTLEVGIIGNEGMVGTPVFLGADRSPTEAIVQVPGEALRLDVQFFQKEMKRDGPLYSLVQRYTQAMINQISQSIICNRRHAVRKRMCRWLLMCHNRVPTDDFLLTQQFLAQMLGVRRPTVTTVAGTLQQAGLITYHRGTVTILDRQGLEAACCECYQVILNELDRLLS